MYSVLRSSDLRGLQSCSNLRRLVEKAASQMSLDAANPCLIQCARVLFVAAFFVFSHSRICQAETYDAFAGFDEYARSALADWNTPGMAIAVVRDGKLVFAHGYGVRKLGENAQVNTETVFPIASITKSFNATGLAMLVDEGRLKWDDAVIKHLPEFQLYNPYITKEVTVSDLLSHRTRLEDPNLLSYSGSVDRNELIRRTRFLKPVAPFRTGCNYNNLMIVVSGEILEKVSGKSWADFVRLRVFEPLEMTSTFNDILNVQDGENIATAYVTVDSNLQEDRSWALLRSESWRHFRETIRPAGSICSTVNDMAKFLNFHLSEGAVRGERLLNADTIQEMQALHSVLALKKPPNAELPYPKFLSGYGLGWQIRDYRGRRIVMHGGSTGTVLAMMPEEKVGIVVLTNLGCGIQYMVMHDVFDRLLGIPRSWTNDDWITEVIDKHNQDNEAANAKLEAERKKEIASKFPLDDYSGTYESDLYGKIVFNTENGKLMMQYGPHCKAELIHWQGEKFRGTFVVRYPVDLFFTFKTTDEDSVERLDVEHVRTPKLLSTFYRIAGGAK